GSACPCGRWCGRLPRRWREALGGARRGGRECGVARARRRCSAHGSRPLVQARPQRWRYKRRPPLQPLSAAERGVLRTHARADRDVVLRRLRQEAGVDLIQLLMAMTILHVEILATVAAFNYAIVTVRRPGLIANAS